MHSSSADATVLSPLPYYLLATTMCGSCARAFLGRFRCVRSIAADGLATARRDGLRGWLTWTSAAALSDAPPTVLASPRP